MDEIRSGAQPRGEPSYNKPQRHTTSRNKEFRRARRVKEGRRISAALARGRARAAWFGSGGLSRTRRQSPGVETDRSTVAPRPGHRHVSCTTTHLRGAPLRANHPFSSNRSLPSALLDRFRLIDSEKPLPPALFVERLGAGTPGRQRRRGREASGSPSEGFRRRTPGTHSSLQPRRDVVRAIHETRAARMIIDE